MNKYHPYRPVIYLPLLPRPERSIALEHNPDLNLLHTRIRKYEPHPLIINRIRKRMYRIMRLYMGNKDQIGETTNSNLNGWIL
jgi:hypothetical protein